MYDTRATRVLEQNLRTTSLPTRVKDDLLMDLANFARS